MPHARTGPPSSSCSTSTASRRSTTRSVTSAATCCCRSWARGCTHCCSGTRRRPPGRRRVRDPALRRKRGRGDRARRPRSTRRSSSPSTWTGSRSRSAASIGIAAFPEHGADVDALVQHADVAMYVAKDAHAGTVRLRPGAGHERRGPPRARRRAAPGDRGRRARRLLPAEGRPRDRPDRRRRGARPLGAPDARLHPARPVHPDRRAHRADQAAEPLRPGDGRCASAGTGRRPGSTWAWPST